ncbi:MAG: D-glutamate deacylase, partial [Proteobacteria bacterium]|nr:D-glutamate deacylase [Pseudomonadota bacterium]
MRRLPLRGLAVLTVGVALSGCGSAADTGDAHDIVIRGARVMDPESGLDAVRDVGVRHGRIAAVP